jgi:hypothetical protein
MRLVIFALLILPALACAAGHPLLPVRLKPSDVGGLRAAIAPLLAMSEAEMLALIPAQSGLYFVGCVNCTGGQQEGQLTVWDVARPDMVKCAYCGQEYPSDKYPTSGVLEVKTPTGTTARYPYHESRPAWWKGQEPYRSYFAARVDYHKMRYLENAAAYFARLYWLTKEPAAGRRAALILARFAEVFPSYCYHYDYPFRQKIIYEGEVAPKDFRRSFRTARWSWWAFLDLSERLLEAYDLMADSGELEKLSGERGREVPAQVRGMLTTMAEQILANEDEMSNMSPGMWADLIQAGRVLERPEWVHEPVARLARMAREQFFSDGAWMEGAPSYHSQVMGGFSNVFAAAADYSDPPGWSDPKGGGRFDNLDLAQDLPEVRRAREALLRMRLPNGRFVPVHDTWWTNGLSALDVSKPDLLPGLGHGVLGSGEKGGQIQAHLTWSPGYGHIHYDGLSLLLFARGQELLSDLGYTHTKWREWTVMTPAHNLVVVDGQNQKADKLTLGHLRTFTAGPDVQAVSVDNPQVYPKVTDLYRRTLVLVKLSPTDSYVVDFFAVKGGQVHDYFLHGSADEAQTLTAPAELALQPLPTLLPEGVKFAAANSEGQSDWTPWHGYGYLRDLQSAQPAQGVVTLDYAPTQTGAGLQAFVVTHAGDQLVLGRSPSIRQAQSDDGKLESYWRQFVMLRREGGESLFAAVLAPYGETKAITQVRVVDLPGARMALEVQSDLRTDLIVLNAVDAQGSWHDRPLGVSAELAVVGLQEGKPQAAMVTAGELRWGDLTLKTGPAGEWPLLGIMRGAEPSLLVGGGAEAAPGAVVTLDHAGEYTSAYTVTKVTREGANTRLFVAEEPGCEWDAKTGVSRFLTIPRMSFTGPHVVRLLPAAHLKHRETP